MAEDQNINMDTLLKDAQLLAGLKTRSAPVCTNTLKDASGNMLLTFELAYWMLTLV